MNHRKDRPSIKTISKNSKDSRTQIREIIIRIDSFKLNLSKGEIFIHHKPQNSHGLANPIMSNRFQNKLENVLSKVKCLVEPILTTSRNSSSQSWRLININFHNTNDLPLLVFGKLHQYCIFNITINNYHEPLSVIISPIITRQQNSIPNTI